MDAEGLHVDFSVAIFFTTFAIVSILIAMQVVVAVMMESFMSTLSSKDSMERYQSLLALTKGECATEVVQTCQVCVDVQCSLKDVHWCRLDEELQINRRAEKTNNNDSIVFIVEVL